MDTIKFTFEETNEEVTFAILGSVEYEDDVYLMVVEENELDNDDMTAYILKEVDDEGDDVTYEIVDDEDELTAVTELFEDVLENFEIDGEDDEEYDDESDEE